MSNATIIAPYASGLYGKYRTAGKTTEPIPHTFAQHGRGLNSGNAGFTESGIAPPGFGVQETENAAKFLWNLAALGGVQSSCCREKPAKPDVWASRDRSQERRVPKIRSRVFHEIVQGSQGSCRSGELTISGAGNPRPTGSLLRERRYSILHLPCHSHPDPKENPQNVCCERFRQTTGARAI